MPCVSPFHGSTLQVGITNAKYVPCYITDMKHLEQKHPESYQHLCQGGFVVRRTGHYNFNAVSTDQALEQTINKEGKSEGGIIGLTLRKDALTRWLVTRHMTAEFSDAFGTMYICAIKHQTRRGSTGN